ncbi:hypothetical protein J3D43_001094 [Paenibacillus xylanexedens]|nr:hypothetical protein [Paenibacillus xylanexedens]
MNGALLYDRLNGLQGALLFHIRLAPLICHFFSSCYTSNVILLHPNLDRQKGLNLPMIIQFIRYR